MSKLVLNNGKVICPMYDGPCEINKPCSPLCKRKHKLWASRKRRIWNKKKLLMEMEGGNKL